MNSARFFCEPPLADSGVIRLPEAVNHHIRVRRLRAGQTIILFDGSGKEVHAELAFEPNGQAMAEVCAVHSIDRELSGQVRLIQGIASQDRMDWVIEKAVELGITSFVPVTAKRSLVKLDGQRAAKRTDHWRRLVNAASEQCGRNRLMQVCPPTDLTHAVQMGAQAPLLVCHLSPQTKPLEEPALLQRIQQANAVTLAIGPEGGWDPAEIEQWLAAGASAISLGPRVLRTETAGLVATAKLSALLGW